MGSECDKCSEHVLECECEDKEQDDKVELPTEVREYFDRLLQVKIPITYVDIETLERHRPVPYQN